MVPEVEANIHLGGVDPVGPHPGQPADLDGQLGLVARVTGGDREAAVVEAFGGEPDEVRDAAEVLVEERHRRARRGQVERADAAQVEAVVEVAQALGPQGGPDLAVRQERHEPQLAGIADDHGPAGAQQGGARRELIDL
jgi:hypothetical protein